MSEVGVVHILAIIVLAPLLLNLPAAVMSALKHHHSLAAAGALLD